MQINWVIVFAMIVLATTFVLWNRITWTIWKEIRNLEQSKSMYKNNIDGIVDLDWIKDWYTFTGVKCTDGISKCFENNLNLFYSSNGKLKTKQVIYFTNDTLSVDFTDSNWYKNWDNIKDINSKIFRWVYIPPLDKLWNLVWIKDLNILLNSQSNLKERFFLSPLWFK